MAAVASRGGVDDELQRGLAVAADVGLLPGCLWRTDPAYVDVPAPTPVASPTFAKQEGVATVGADMPADPNTM